jgi:transposase
MRTRKQLSRELTRHVQRIQKTLEAANIKLSTVICDGLGVSGRRMIEAMIAGVDDPGQLAELADRRLKAAPQERCEPLHGRLTGDEPKPHMRVEQEQLGIRRSPHRRSTPRPRSG